MWDSGCRGEEIGTHGHGLGDGCGFRNGLQHVIVAVGHSFELALGEKLLKGLHGVDRVAECLKETGG